MRALGWLLVVAALGVTTGAGCGDGGAPCAQSDVPQSCPTPVPSFAGQVAGIFASRCAACHAPAGVEASKPYQTYDQIVGPKSATFPDGANVIHLLTQIRACRMPQPGAPPLTSDEGKTLQGWLYCGAPNN
jgi:hypothetical protein